MLNWGANPYNERFYSKLSVITSYNKLNNDKKNSLTLKKNIFKLQSTVFLLGVFEGDQIWYQCPCIYLAHTTT